MRVSVTAEDIAEGVARSNRSCPIALAIRRQPWVEYVSVGISNATVEDADGYGFGNLPQSAVLFIHDFDNNGPDAVQPFEFDLDLETEDDE